MGDAKPPYLPQSIRLAPDVGTGDRFDLSSYADQLMAIAEQLRSGSIDRPNARSSPIAETATETAPGTQTFAAAPALAPDYAELAKNAYAMRRTRDAIFGASELFGEPAWDILLDLFIAHTENKPVSVSSACIGSAAPPTTGLRWLGVLTENEMIVREHDPEDQRRVLVRLSDKAIEAMEQYFRSAAQRAASA
jgi:hypothetical protein